MWCTLLLSEHMRKDSFSRRSTLLHALDFSLRFALLPFQVQPKNQHASLLPDQQQTRQLMVLIRLSVHFLLQDNRLLVVVVLVGLVPVRESTVAD